MRSSVYQDFQERSREVRKYFLFLKNLEQGTTQLCIKDKHKNPRYSAIDSELEKTLKAGAFLLLYNLVESTMSNAIELIFDEVRNKGVDFDRLRPELKKIILKNLKKRDPDKILSSITAISLDIATAVFDKQELFSGNVDSRLMREMAKMYGFSHNTNYQKTDDGRDLLTVKNNRNHLAHGIKSFSEVGRDYSTEDLIKMQKKVTKYLNQILDNIETYINNQEYLNSS